MMTKLPEPMDVARAALRLCALFTLAAGACAGIVYGAWQGSLSGVVVSALLPGTCALMVVTRSPWRTRPSGE